MRDGKSESLCLSRLVIRVLANDHDPYRIKGREAKGAEDLVRGWKDDCPTRQDLQKSEGGEDDALMR